MRYGSPRQYANGKTAVCVLIASIAVIAARTATPVNGGEDIVLGSLMCSAGNIRESETLTDGGKTDEETAVGQPEQTKRDVTCKYQPLESGIEEFYTGTLSVVGPDDAMWLRGVYRDWYKDSTEHYLEEIVETANTSKSLVHDTMTAIRCLPAESVPTTATS